MDQRDLQRRCGNQERRERDRLIDAAREGGGRPRQLHPVGRGGAGAPLRNVDGGVIANLREVTRDTLGEKTRDSSQPPAVHNLLERTRPGAEPPARPGAPFVAPHQTACCAAATDRRHLGRASPPAVGGPDDYEKDRREST